MNSMYRRKSWTAFILCAAMAWVPVAGMPKRDYEDAKESKEYARESKEYAKESKEYAKENKEYAKESKERDEAYEEAVEDGVREATQDAYDKGKEAIEEEEWQDAVRYFNKVIMAKSELADGALYWKSYALSRMGNMADALKGLDELPKVYASSRWVKDAKALAIELRQSGGRPVAPERVDDEELKLIALNSLMSVDPDKALPMLQKVLNGTGSPRLKEQALFVLMQDDSPQARQIAMSIARGQSNPDLQRKALEYLGMEGDAQTAPLLRDVYASTTDTSIKRSILQGYMASDDTQGLLHVLSVEKDPELRRHAIDMLGAQGASDELARLYRTEPDARTRQQILQSLGVAGDADQLASVLRVEKEPRLRRAAVQALGIIDEHEAGPLLEQIYAAETDREVRAEVLQSFMVQDNARALINIARKEKDPGLKKKAVEMLSHMDDPAAIEFLMEILEQ